MRHGSALFVASTAGSGALFLFHFLASRRLGVENYGVLASLLAFVASISFAASVGTAIVARFGAQYQALGEAGKLRRLNDLVVNASWATVAIGCLLAAALSGQFAAFFHVEGLWSLALTIALAALGIVLALMRGVQQGMQSFTALSVSQIIETAGKAALGAGAVIAHLGVLGVMLGQIAASVVSVVYIFVNTRARLHAVAERLHLDLRLLVRACAGIGGAYIALAVLITADVILAKHFLSARESGLYAVASFPGRAMATIMFVLPTMLLPKAAARASAGRPSLGLMRVGFGITAGAWLFALVAFYFFPGAIVHIIAGSAFADAAPLVFLYGCSAALFAFVSVAVSLRAGHDSFGFVVPLLIVVALEVVAIAYYHQSASDIVRVLIGAEAAALAVSLFGIWNLGLPRATDSRAS